MPRIYREKKSVIRNLRQQLNMFQAELADMLKITQTMVSKFERFEKKPSEKMMIKLMAIAHRYGIRLTQKMIEEDYE